MDEKLFHRFGPLIIIAVSVIGLLLLGLQCEADQKKFTNEKKRLVINTARAEHPECKKVSLVKFSEHLATVRVCDRMKYYRHDNGRGVGKWIELGKGKKK